MNSEAVSELNNFHFLLDSKSKTRECSRNSLLFQIKLLKNHILVLMDPEIGTTLGVEIEKIQGKAEYLFNRLLEKILQLFASLG